MPRPAKNRLIPHPELEPLVKKTAKSSKVIRANKRKASLKQSTAAKGRGPHVEPSRSRGANGPEGSAIATRLAGSAPSENPVTQR